MEEEDEYISMENFEKFVQDLIQKIELALHTTETMQ